VAGVLFVTGCVASGEGGALEGRPSAARVTIEEAAPAPLRRLTREEYDHALRDALGERTAHAERFPHDEAVAGFENNTIAPITDLAVQRYADVAEEVAAKFGARAAELAPCPRTEGSEACLAAFLDSVGRRLYRRPIAAEERAELGAVYAKKASAAGHAEAIRLVLEIMLQSPAFLYRLEPSSAAGAAVRALDGFEVATRLAFFLWTAPPDDALLDDAASGRLGTADGVEQAAKRMLADPRAVEGLVSFHRQWLGLRELETESKGSTSPTLTRAMLEETARFVAYAASQPGDDLRTLLTSRTSFVDAELAQLYGVALPAGGSGGGSGGASSGGTFVRVELPAAQRAGVLTHASVLAAHASASQTAPILRGKFLRERLLCQEIPPPPSGTVITPPAVDPKVPTKQRFEQHRTNRSCSGCHQLMDPVGFGFEHYDALGAWRDRDGDFAVDATSELTGTADVDGPFDGAIELAARLAESAEVRRCYARQWFRFAAGRGEVESDAPSLDAITTSFERSGFDVDGLRLAIVRTHAFRFVGAASSGEGAP
jgi:hypothetical protein